MPRFAAKLLFEYCLDKPRSRPAPGRIFEEAIVNFRSANARAAVKRARATGISKEFNYTGALGRRVYKTFLGIMELLKLEPACDDDEVWYDICQYRSQKKVDALIPPDQKLNAMLSRSVRTAKY